MSELQSSESLIADNKVNIHEFADGHGSLTANVNVKYQSVSFTNVDNNPLDVIPEHTVGDAWLAWNSDNDKWMVQAWVRNFTDEVYRTHVFTQRGNRIAFGTFAPPRTYGLTLQFSY